MWVALGGAAAFAGSPPEGFILVETIRSSPAVILLSEPEQPALWWPGRAEREAVLHQLPAVAKAIRDRSWSHFEVDKLLMHCSRSDLGLDELCARYPTLARVELKDVISLVRRLALANRLNQYLFDYRKQNFSPLEFVTYWKESGLFDEELLDALVDRRVSKALAWPVCEDPLYGPCGRSHLRYSAVAPQPVHREMDLRVYFDTGNGPPRVPYLIYRFVRSPEVWLLHDILCPEMDEPGTKGESLREWLGLAED